MQKIKINNKCMLYAIPAAINYRQISDHPERTSKIKRFINKYDWKDIKFPAQKEDWNTFEKSNKSITLNILYVPCNAKQIRPAYVSKYNRDRENQVILLMITDGKKWHYLPVKDMSALFRGITSKHVGDFYFSNCFCSFRTENALKNHESVCKDHDYCYIEMPDKGNNILKYNPGEKCMKIPFIIYADTDYMPEKVSTCSNNPEKSSTIKLNKHKPSGFSLFTYCSFNTKNKLDYYRGEDCMKVFCNVLKEHVERIKYWEKKEMIPEMIPLTEEENRSYENQKHVINGENCLRKMIKK